MDDDAAHQRGWLPLHRSEALTDGIFAVAMTLLVIELKLPEHALVHGGADLADALIGLLPKAMSWALSFFVLALFWIGHHRAHAFVRRTDSRLVALNLLELAVVSLMPFSTALSGEYGRAMLAQVVFSTNMALLGITAFFVVRYIHRHPELGPTPMPLATYRSARLRIGGLILISVVAVAIAPLFASAAMGNIAFMLMALLTPISRRLERRALRAPDDAPDAPHEPQADARAAP
jgi:uncharacterized membrane protein